MNNIEGTGALWFLSAFCLIIAAIFYGYQQLWPMTWLFLMSNLLVGVPFIMAQIFFLLGVMYLFLGKAPSYIYKNEE